MGFARSRPCKSNRRGGGGAVRDLGVGRKTEKVISHWFASLQCDNCFMNPPSIFTLLFSFGSFVWTISLSPMLTMALKHSPLWRASMEAFTWSKPLNVWVMKGSKAISPLITVCTNLGTSVLDFQPPGCALPVPSSDQLERP